MPHRRLHDMRCTECQTRNPIRIFTEDVPGGIRAGCEDCGRPTVHRIDHELHTDLPLIACVGCGEWVGDRDTCSACGAVAEITGKTKVPANEG